ncbi:MAG TPA: stage II sporulation protein M, partial [Acidimicrobiia bacterium]
SAGVLRLGSCYRAVAADLAFARRRFPSDPIVGRLERLTQRGRNAVYNTSSSRNSVRAFATRGYWRRVRERPALLAIAVVCLALPTLLSGYWAWRDPGAASGLAPSAYQSVTQPRPDGQDLGVSVDEQSDLAARIFTNNIQVSFLAFAGGILLGLGTLYLLIENGIMLGAVAGLAIGAGNGRAFFELVVAHGVLELSCIVVSGAAGLRLASAIVDPGTRPRMDALRTEARAAVEIVLGTAVWLVVAGLVEGFLTPAGKGLAVVLVVGLGLGVLFWGLVWWRGAPERPTATTAPEP